MPIKLEICIKGLKVVTFAVFNIKGLFTNFEYIIKFFPCPNKRNIFYERSILIKKLWLKIIEKNGTQSQSVLYIYIIYTTRTDFDHNFSQLLRVRVVSSRWTPYEIFFCWDTKNLLNIQNWWTIPLSLSTGYKFIL